MKEENMKNIEKECMQYLKTDNLAKFQELLEEYDFDDKELFYSALDWNALIIMEFLIKERNIVKRIKKDFNYSLRYAAQKQKVGMVKLLHKYGADLHENQEYVFRLAVAEKNMELFNYCLDKKVDIHAHEDYPIKEAAMNGDILIIEILLSHGAEIKLAKEFVRGKEAEKWIKDYMKKEKMVKNLEKTLPEQTKTKKANKI